MLLNDKLFIIECQARRKSSPAKRTNHHSQFQALYMALHRAREAVLITDDSLRTQYANKAAERLLNCKLVCSFLLLASSPSCRAEEVVYTLSNFFLFSFFVCARMKL